jgi:hypothetical protein
MGALCFVTLFGVVGAKPLPLGEPRVLIRSVKTHTGLLLTKVTKLCIMDSIEGRCSYGSSINATR